MGVVLHHISLLTHTHTHLSTCPSVYLPACRSLTRPLFSVSSLAPSLSPHLLPVTGYHQPPECCSCTQYLAWLWKKGPAKHFNYAGHLIVHTLKAISEGISSAFVWVH